MSELKVASCFEFEKVLRGKSNKLFYPKSEVDKVIAEKDKEIAELKEERRWRNVDDMFPTADEGYILVLWEDGLPDIGYIGAEDDVIATVRDRGEGHSVEWWMPLPSAPKEEA